MFLVNYSRMHAFEEGTLHLRYEKVQDDQKVWYLRGLLYGTALLMDEQEFNIYANRWDICPTGVTREAFMFGYYHAKNLRLGAQE